MVLSPRDDTAIPLAARAQRAASRGAETAGRASCPLDVLGDRTLWAPAARAVLGARPAVALVGPRPDDGDGVAPAVRGTGCGWAGPFRFRVQDRPQCPVGCLGPHDQNDTTGRGRPAFSNACAPVDCSAGTARHSTAAAL